jgi:hypothetical protein
MSNVRGCPDEFVTPSVRADTDIVVEYYTAQPSPTQWIAVAEIAIRSRFDPDCCSNSLLVGTGQAELEAVDALLARLSSLGITDAMARPKLPVDLVQHVTLRRVSSSRLR